MVQKKETTKKVVKKSAVKKEPAQKKGALATGAKAVGRKVKEPAVSLPLGPEEILATVKKVLEDGKAQDITIIELKGKTSLADYMIIATGSSQRQVVALAEKVALELKAKKVRTSVEGKEGGEWVIVDASDVIVHVFYPETRAFYSLEEIWNALPKVGK